MRCGGVIIKRKLFLSVILLFGLVLVLNFNTTSAASINNTTLSVKAVDPANHSIIQNSKNIKVTFSENVKISKNHAELKSSTGKVVKIQETVKGKTLTLVLKGKLAYGKYVLTLHSATVQNKNGVKNSLYTSCFTVSPITLAQMKDGKARADKFYAVNGRLPNYINFGSKKISIAEFQKLLATQNLKVNTTLKVKSFSTSKTSGCSAYNITLTNKTVSATSKCSCGTLGDYTYHTSTYKNYCPSCHKYGSLVWNPKGVEEGEWTCSSCDCDYCAACGKEKVYVDPKYLVKA
jgi:methionine-rich copper-binding protein CopC